MRGLVLHFRPNCVSIVIALIGPVPSVYRYYVQVQISQFAILAIKTRPVMSHMIYYVNYYESHSVIIIVTAHVSPSVMKMERYLCGVIGHFSLSAAQVGLVRRRRVHTPR